MLSLFFFSFFFFSSQVVRKQGSGFFNKEARLFYSRLDSSEKARFTSSDDTGEVAKR